MTSETSLSILELMLSFPGNLCIIRAISSGVKGQENILFLQGYEQYLLKSNCPASLSDCIPDTGQQIKNN